jgi:hypothetical protein
MLTLKFIYSVDIYNYIETYLRAQTEVILIGCIIQPKKEYSTYNLYKYKYIPRWIIHSPWYIPTR